MDFLRVIREYLPPPSLWLLAIVTVGLFVWFAERGVRLGRRHPIALAVGMAALTLAVVSDIMAIVQDRESLTATTTAQFIRGNVAILLGSFFFLGVAAIGFRGLRSTSRNWRAAGSVLAGLVAFPVGLLVTLYAACMFGLGCI